MAGGEVSNTPIQQKDPIASLLDTINAYSGKTTTSTTGPSSSTTKSNITPEQLDALISSAMAPLSQASHGAGISPYSDTTLALGRGQVAAEIGAKYAGTTTTESGKTNTQTTTQNPLTGSNLKTVAKSYLTGQALKGLAVNPVTKALAKKTGIDDIGKSVGDWITNLGTVTPEAGIGGASGTDMSMFYDQGPGNAAMDTGLAASLSDLGTGALEAGIGGASGADASLFYDAGSAATDAASSIGSDLISGGEDIYSLFFADGGRVSTKKYADGGNVFVDRFTPSSTKPDSSTATPEINALYQEIVPGKDKVDILKGLSDTGGSSDVGTTGTTSANSNSGFSLSPVGLGIAGMQGLSLGGPMGAITAMGMNTIGQVAIAALSNIAHSISDSISSQSDANAVSTGLSVDSTGEGISTGPSGTNAGPGGIGIGSSAASGIGAGIGDAVGAVSTGVSSGDSGDSGDSSGGDGGGDGGVGAALATGGNISGPGTETSDSILAHLSDGERVITAKTNEAVEKMFPGFFHMLEQEFNPQAAAAQLRKGQA